MGRTLAKLQKSEQINTLHRALTYVTNFSQAIDGGANVGDWTAVMALRFAEVHSIEPNTDCFALLKEKFGDAHNVTLHHAGLWCENGPLTLNPLPGHPTKVRGMFVTPGGDLTGITVDSLGLTNLGLLKLDCEGADFHALQGATDTIDRCKPVCVVEVKQRALDLFKVREYQIDTFFIKRGAVELFRMGPDRVYGWA